MKARSRLLQMRELHWEHMRSKVALTGSPGARPSCTSSSCFLVCASHRIVCLQSGTVQ